MLSCLNFCVITIDYILYILSLPKAALTYLQLDM